MKHIILPVSEHFSTPRVPTILGSPSNYHNPSLWGNPTPQLDSVLNQYPMQSPLQYPPMFGYMPQPLQPPFVPTALGSVPPAPFWPAGNSGMLLPVATQDAQFYNPWRPNQNAWSIPVQQQNPYMMPHQQQQQPMLYAHQVPAANHSYHPFEPLPPTSPTIRDRIYQQAVSIYIELIKNLNKSRFNNKSTQIRYPKPPRTSQDLTHPPPPQRHHSTGALQFSRPHLSPHHRHSYVEGWQSTQDNSLIRPPQLDRLGHLRREGTEPLHSSTSIIPRQDHYPVQNAISALEQLTIHCEASSWSWIEGILLGGSLAYALADYPKALDWYNKIIAKDPL
jgi:hypothetical protein